MAAFAAAADLGYTWVETDVHATHDGVVLAFHDPTLDRMTDAEGVIANLEWAEVSKARIAGREPVPQLRDLLDRLPTLQFNIDIKADDAVVPLVDVVEQMHAHDRVRITSFSDRRRQAALRRLSEPVRTSSGQTSIVVLWLASRFGAWVFAHALRTVARGENLDALQIPERHGRLRILDWRLLKAAHASGIEVHVWTVNDREEMERLLDLGVDGLITDRADVLKEVLVQRGQWHGAS